MESIALFLLIFVWTPPHFWALALYRAGDYAAAGIPMLPVVAGKAATRRQILIYSLVLVPVSLLPFALGTAGLVYGGAAMVLGPCFVLLALKVRRDKGTGAARRLFGFSILYLFVLFAALILAQVPWLAFGRVPGLLG